MQRDDRPRVRVVCGHERTPREKWAQRFVVELEDGRQQPYSMDEIEAAREAESTKSIVVAGGLPEVQHALMRDDLAEVPHLAAGVMVVGRAPGVVAEAAGHLPEMGRSPQTGIPYRRGRTLKLPCRSCGRYVRASEVTLGAVLDATYQLVPNPDAHGRRTVTLALIETAIRML